jgi:hypothetical protein
MFAGHDQSAPVLTFPAFPSSFVDEIAYEKIKEHAG